jgi:SpoVK/Ycf46/Vps4 family AAA+-type ATPase
MDNKPQTAPTPLATPGWYEALAQKYQAGISHAFIAHMNINDLVTPQMTVRNYLNYRLGSNCPVIAWYDRAQGITFPFESMRSNFIKATGYEAGPETPQLAALRAISPTAGGVGGAAQLPTEPERALPLLERLLRSKAPDNPERPGEPQKYVVIIDGAETLVPASDISTMGVGDRTALLTIERWGRDPRIMSSGNIVILLTTNLSDLHPKLRAASSRYEAVQIPLPDTATRRAFILTYLSDKPAGLSTLSTEEIARQTGGLQTLHVEDIFLRASYEYDRSSGQSGLTAALIQERKAQIIETEFGGLLEIVEPYRRFSDIGGMEVLKNYIRTVVIEPMNRGIIEIVPMAILLSGPPGTGKTALAEAIATEVGINFVFFNPGRLKGQYVGQSEANLERALAAIQTLAPVGIFIDELDAALTRGGGGDSGVSSYIFGRLLNFIANPQHRGQILWIGATNFPNSLDPALTRAGRFGDLKLAILPPSADERALIFAIQARRYTRQDVAIIPEECIAGSEGWTGAEIEKAARKAAELIYTRQLSVEEALRRAMEYVVPTTANIPAMISEALDNVDDLELLPEAYRKIVVERRTRPSMAVMETAPVQRQQRRL